MTKNKFSEELRKRLPQDAQNLPSMPVIDKKAKAFVMILTLHSEIEITLPNGEWGSCCQVCQGFKFPCNTRLAIMEAMA
jgi:hypothetical protein